MKKLINSGPIIRQNNRNSITRLFILLIIMFSFSICRGQNETDLVQNTFNQIIDNQIFNELDTDIPLFVVVPGLIIAGNINSPNYDIQFQEHDLTDYVFTDEKKIFENEIIKSLNCNFFASSPVVNSSLINAFYKDNLVFSLNNSNQTDIQEITLKVPNEDMSRESKYQHGKLESVVLKKGISNTMMKKDYSGDSLITTTVYNNLKQKFTITEERYDQKLLLEEITYQPNYSRSVRKINTIIRNGYTPEGKRFIEKTINRKGKETDSTKFYHENSLLTNIIQYKANGQRSVLLGYELNGRLSKKTLYYENNIISLKYAYNGNNQIETIEMMQSLDQSGKKCVFNYNAESRLISIQFYNFPGEMIRMNLETEYIFSYSEIGMLNSLKAVDKKGHIVKAIDYSFENIE